MPENLVDSAFDLDLLLSKLTESLRKAAGDLSKSFDEKGWEEPYVYRIPRMQVSVKLSLSYSQDKVKGILIWKNTTAQEQSLVSTLDLEMVAVPRNKEKDTG